jgi:hypothetical protein
MVHVMTRGIALLGLCLLCGCDENPTNTALCRNIYTALCNRADECGEIESLDECIVFYREDCRVRRLPANVREPTESEVDACLAAVTALDCSHTTSADVLELSACRFLVEPPEDAGVEDTGTDSGGDADAAADGG